MRRPVQFNQLFGKENQKKSSLGVPKAKKLSFGTGRRKRNDEIRIKKIITKKGISKELRKYGHSED